MSVVATKDYGKIKVGDTFNVVRRVADCYEIETENRDYRNWFVPIWVFQ